MERVRACVLTGICQVPFKSLWATGFDIQKKGNCLALNLKKTSPQQPQLVPQPARDFSNENRQGHRLADKKGWGLACTALTENGQGRCRL
jgi:hypothetical protein